MKSEDRGSEVGPHPLCCRNSVETGVLTAERAGGGVGERWGRPGGPVGHREDPALCSERGWKSLGSFAQRCDGTGLCFEHSLWLRCGGQTEGDMGGWKQRPGEAFCNNLGKKRW